MFEETKTSALDFVRRLAQQRLDVDQTAQSLFMRFLGQSPKTYWSHERHRTALEGITLLSTLGENAPASDGSPQRFGALHTIDEALAVPGWKGLGMHPHVDTEVVTFVISGQLRHEEGSGRVRQIGAYELQVLSSGRGVEHNESNARSDAPLEFFQILLDADEPREPVHVDKIQLPLGAEDGVHHLAVGSEVRAQGPALHLRQRWSRIAMLKVSSGSTVAYERLAFHSNGLFVFVIEGELEVDHARVLGRRDGLAIKTSPEGGSRLVNFEGRATTSIALIFDVPSANIPHAPNRVGLSEENQRGGGLTSEAAEAYRPQPPYRTREAMQGIGLLKERLLRTVTPAMPEKGPVAAHRAPHVEGEVQSSDYLVDFLISQGVRHVFGYAGSSVLPLIEAIRRRGEAIKWVLMRHEGSAALAASAVSKLTGGVGALVVSSGPGATNTITGLLDAERDRAAVICLTGKIPSAAQYRTPYQDVDNAHIIGAAVRNSVTLTQEEQLPAVLRRAASELRVTRGVWHIALANDLLQKKISGLEAREASRHFTKDQALPQPLSEDVINDITRRLSRVERLVIAVGPRAVGCGRLIESLATATGAPIVTQLDAKGIVDELHPHAFGVLGVFGYPANACAFEALEQASGILLVGVTDPRYFLQKKDGSQKVDLTLIQIDPPFITPTPGFHVEARVEGAIDASLRALLVSLQKNIPMLRQLPSPLLERKAAHAQKLMLALEFNPSERMHPGAIFLTLSSFLTTKQGSIVAIDVGAITLWAAQYLLLTRDEVLLTSRELATMGCSLPACIAASLTLGSESERLVVGIVGDGAMQMSLAELGAAVQSGARFILLVVNNGSLGAIAQQQPDGEQRHGTSLLNPDFVTIAEAYGAKGERVTQVQELSRALERAAASQLRGPYVIEVTADDKEPMPLFVG